MYYSYGYPTVMHTSLNTVHVCMDIPLLCTLASTHSLCCSSLPFCSQDLSYAMLLYVCLIAAVFLFFVLAFHPRYRRTESDRRSSLEESVFLPDSMKASRKPFNPPSGQ